MLSVVIEAFKKSVMFLCTPFANRCLVYSDWALYHLAQLIRLVGIFPVQIHLITAVSVIKRLSLYEFTLWGRDLVSVVRIRESSYHRGFLKENMRTLSGLWKLSVLERCPYREVRLYLSTVFAMVPFLLSFVPCF